MRKKNGSKYDKVYYILPYVHYMDGMIMCEYVTLHTIRDNTETGISLVLKNSFTEEQVFHVAYECIH